MGYAQLRFETRSRSAIKGALAEHVSGNTRPETAVAREAWDGRAVLELYQVDRDTALETIEAARVQKRRGRPGAEAVEILMGGPAPLDAPEAWSRKRLLAWADDSVAWAKKQIGSDGVLVSAHLHVDERSPHVHVVIIPVIADPKGPTLSWRRVRARAAGERDDQVSRADARRQASRLQDSYSVQVGEPHGLQRGRAGSKAQHHPTDRMQGLVDRVTDQDRALAVSAGVVNRLRTQLRTERSKTASRLPIERAQVMRQARAVGRERVTEKGRER